MSEMHFSSFYHIYIAFVFHTTENVVTLLLYSNHWWQVPEAHVSLGTKMKAYFRCHLTNMGKQWGY